MNNNTRTMLKIFAIFCACQMLPRIAGVGYRPFGPDLKGTQGEAWPKPYWQDDTGLYYALDPANFQLVTIGQTCDILQQAIVRYTDIIRNSANGYARATANANTIGVITQVKIDLKASCQTLPSLEMDESYYVHGDGRVIANSVWGILRGLETLSQLLVPMSNGLLRIPETEIYDQPRFPYRGLMLDSARHFISKAKILQLLEGMAYNKLNVFHWHITDDSAFPYNSTTFPELSAKGAYRTDLTYSPADVVEIVEFARIRGIRVVPEFDSPAHSASWGASHPEIMTECFGDYTGQLGPFNPTKESTFQFLHSFFSEIRALFPDRYIHLGVDEVASACWESNPQIQSYLAANNLDNGDVPYIYLNRLTADLSAMNWRQMVWQEGMINYPQMSYPANTIAQIWFDYANVAKTLTKRGQRVIRSDGWYMYVLETGGDWEKFYELDPTAFDGTAAQKRRVSGGEACLWGEWINEHNVLPTTFPRVSAIAERLWSEEGHRDTDEARLRLEEHNCRMVYRGIEARPANSYGLC